ncbi:hypothetical protein BY458DRAFT_433843 [Sporodiniella umbellata]|nr:hypothetical protein BY458DRAFT_433843 [Sporodiniella umbellata]
MYLLSFQQQQQQEDTAMINHTFLDLEQNEWSKNLITILLTVGASETKHFFLLLNNYFLSSKHRLQIVYLLSEFMRRRYDNSTTLIATSVTNLIMLLPRICTSLPPFLPQLFYIFARAICWDQLRDLRKKQSIDASYHAPTYIADGWDCVEKDFTIPEEFDEETFKTRTITQVTRHMLHPNLVLLDIESELTDKTRWMKMEPPDVMAQIMGLDLTHAASRVAFSNENKSQRPENLLDECLWGNTPKEEEGGQGKKQVEKEPEKKAPTAMASNIMNLHKALKSGSEVLVGDDVWDSAGIQQEAITEENLQTSSETKLILAGLKREVLLLRNELNFELFLKQQHLQHIGRLHREHVLDSSVEAERQQLYNTTRMLRGQLNQTTLALEKLRAESALTKQKHIKWEDEQSGKLRGYREARKDWQNQMTQIEYQIEENKKQVKSQKEQLDLAKQHVLELENELQTLDPVLHKATENEHRVKQLTQQMLLWEKDTSHMEEQKRYIKELLSQWWSMEELVASLQSGHRRLQDEQLQREEQLEKLRVQITESQPKVNSNLPKNTTETSNEVQQLKQALNEAKSRLEQLEIEKLEWDSQVEALRFQVNQNLAKPLKESI